MARRKSKSKNHPGSIDQRENGAYRIRLCVAGRKVTFTLGAGASLADAKQFARDKSAELEKNAARYKVGLPAAPAFSALLERFERERVVLLAPNTQKTYRGSVQLFRMYFVDLCSDPTIDHIRARHIKEFLSWVRTQGRKDDAAVLGNRSIQKHRAVLHAVFALAEELELRDGNPATRVKPPKSDPRQPELLSNDQYDALLRECAHNPMLMLYATMLGETGVRSGSEALWLRWEDLDLDNNFIWVSSGRDGHRTKSGRGRWVPLTARLLQGLREHVLRFRAARYGDGTSPWVFHHPVARRRAKAGERIGSLRRAFDAAASRAELPADFHQHDLRHRRVTKWLAEGANPVHVKEAVGHADLRTTMGYTHLAREHLRTLVSVPAESPEERPNESRA